MISLETATGLRLKYLLPWKDKPLTRRCCKRFLLSSSLLHIVSSKGIYTRDLRTFVGPFNSPIHTAGANQTNGRIINLKGPQSATPLCFSHTGNSTRKETTIPTIPNKLHADEYMYTYYANKPNLCGKHLLKQNETNYGKTKQ